MGKASSKKKVARAAKAGGGRARAAGERNLLFPTALVLVAILGTLLVVYARENRSAEALEAPLAFEDHWHASYGFHICDRFLPDLPQYTAPRNSGLHSHGNGLIHIHPFSTARAGENATLSNWLLDGGEALGGGGDISDDSLGVPGGQTYVEGEDTCSGLEGAPIVQVAVWDSAIDALDEADPDRVITEGFDDIRLDHDGQAFTIAFAPDGAELPPPPSTPALQQVGSDLGVDPGDIEVPEDEDLGDVGGTSDGDDTGDAEQPPSDEPDAGTDSDTDPGS